MTDAPQRAASALGKGGCYVLCILKLAERLTGRLLDPLLEFVDAITRGRVDGTAFVWQAGALLSDFTGGTWEVLKAGDGVDSAGRAYDLPLSYVAQAGELEIDRYEVEGAPGHFVLTDWDPWGESRAVREGRLVSKRIFRRVS